MLTHDPHVAEAPTRAPLTRTLAPRDSVERLFHHLLAPVAGAIAYSLLTGPDGAPYEAALLAFLAYFCAALPTGRDGRWTSLLRLMALVSRLTGPLLGTVVLAAGARILEVPGSGILPLAGALAAASAFSVLGTATLRRYWEAEPRIRVAVIGSLETGTSLARELQLAGSQKYFVVGRIAGPDDDHEGDVGEVRRLGGLHELGEIVDGNRIDLLVMSGEVPRLTVFNELAASCLHLPVRLWELSGFYEDVFGHVPVREINASWFQYIMHPKYRPHPPTSKRVIDLGIALFVALVSLPLLLVLALLIRRDGGPALFRQVRIGEGGRPFTVYKLRTMKMGTGTAAQWASADDPRITRIGRILRKSHVDEFPQLINVIKGDMSLVGPRPEQPEFVERLEDWVPFYTRRHLLKPGITGWAQVRCGYAGSDVGSAWKLCHDLYYLKHRSTAFDLVILGETIRTLFADRQFAVEPNNVSFIVDAAWLQTEPAPVSVAR